uniref:Selenocysteine lyase n=1 Tax=Caligus rogercresseyi TaxID=217165 RepID=C1BQU5_CALRO|nr:Selenocysteine lyase [Caligus rogercresseyi]
MEDLPVYLDNNATTPLHPDVIAEIQESLHRDWSNPSSSYGRGAKVRHEILSARRSLSLMVGGPVGEDALNQAITFTSGGTESNHLAIHSALEAIKKRTGGKPHVVTTNVEHVAIEKPLRALEADNVIGAPSSGRCLT